MSGVAGNNQQVAEEGAAAALGGLEESELDSQITSEAQANAETESSPVVVVVAMPAAGSTDDSVASHLRNPAGRKKKRKQKKSKHSRPREPVDPEAETKTSSEELLELSEDATTTTSSSSTRKPSDRQHRSSRSKSSRGLSEEARAGGGGAATKGEGGGGGDDNSEHRSRGKKQQHKRSSKLDKKKNTKKKKEKKKKKKKKKRSRKSDEDASTAAILAALKQPKGLADFLAMDVDALAPHATRGSSSSSPSSSGGDDDDDDNDDDNDGDAPTSLVASASAAMAAMQLEKKQKPGRRNRSQVGMGGGGGKGRAFMSEADAMALEDEFPMAFKLKLRPGNQYSFVSRLEPDFDHHFRVTVLKEEGDPDVVHVSVNHAGTTMSILQWWPQYLTRLGISAPPNANAVPFVGGVEGMAQRIEQSLAPRFPPGAYIGVEYEGRFRLCSVSQIRVNSPSNSSVPALRAALTEELESIRQDQKSVRFGRRLGSSGGGGGPSAISRPGSAATTQASASGTNHMDELDLQLMIGILPSKMPASLAASLKQRGNGGSASRGGTDGGGVVAGAGDIAAEHSIVTMSTFSLLLTNSGLPGMEGLGEGFIRALGGVDFFHSDAIETTAIPLQYLPVGEKSVWLDHVLDSSSSAAVSAAAAPHTGSDASSSPSAKTLLMSQPRVAGPALRDAAIMAVRAKDDGNYRNPIQKLLFLS